MKTIRLFFTIYILCALFISCSNDDDNYGLESMRCDLEVINATDGGVISGIGSGIYKKGDKVNLSITLKENHILKGWYDKTADILLCEELEYSFTIQEQKTVIEVRYIRTDEDVEITSDLNEIEGFYKDKKSVMFNVFSSAYDKYKAYIVADNVNVADFTLNGENANQQKEIDITNGNTPVTVSIKSMTEGRNSKFKLVVYPVLAPENKEEHTITLINNGASFTVTGGGTFTLTYTNATQSGWYGVKNYQGSASYTITCAEDQKFKAYSQYDNSIGEYIISGVSLQNKLGAGSSVNLPSKSGSITLGRNNKQGMFGWYEDSTEFQYESNMGGSIARKNYSSTEWKSAFTEYIYFINGIGYEQKLPVTIKFNRR